MLNIDYITDTMTRLVNVLNDSAPGELDHDIAVGILSNLKEVADGNIQDAADLCYVSTSTISRFVKKLRFENYNSFKYKLSSDLFFPRSLTSPIPSADIANEEFCVDTYFRLLEEHIQELREVASRQVLDDICDMMHEYPNIFIFSHKSLAFDSFQVGMIAVNKLIRHLKTDEDMLKMIPTFNSGTLIIGPLYPTSNAKQKLLLCKERGAKVISICRENKTLFNDLSDISIAIDTVSGEFNEYMMNFLFDAILLNYRRKFAK